MDGFSRTGLTTRREMLRAGGAMAGGALLTGLLPTGLLAGASSPARPQAAQKHAAAAEDPLAKARAEMCAVPLRTLQLRPGITMLSGPGGNIVVYDGPDGKLMIDSGVKPASHEVLAAVGALGPAPLKFLIDTHWHFDHTDGNAAMHAAGATILSHTKTRERLSTPQFMKELGMHFPARTGAMLPQQTFSDSFEVYWNRDKLALAHFPPAHTDTDIYIHFTNSNVLHTGDIWFNGFYPFLDPSTGGRIDGMIHGAAVVLSLTDNQTKIVPGHGPLGTRAELVKYHEMLVGVRDRVQALKRQGKTVEEAVAAKPTAAYDAAWGKGMFPPAFFVRLVYNTL